MQYLSSGDWSGEHDLHGNVSTEGCMHMRVSCAEPHKHTAMLLSSSIESEESGTLLLGLKQQGAIS